MKEIEDMVIEMAGVPAEIRCRFERNRQFFRDYVSSAEPVFCICPSDEDLCRMQEIFNLMKRRQGLPPRQLSEVALENNVIHALLAQKLVDYGGLLMHGSALCMDGEAFIFTAPSGTGKSTHTRLWREVFGDRVWMINDDKPFVRLEDEQVMVYGNPWNGKHRLGRNGSAPLKAVTLIRQAKENRIRPMNKPDAFSVLMKQVYRAEDPDVMRKIVALEQILLDKIPFYILECNMEPDAARTAREGIINRS